MTKLQIFKNMEFGSVRTLAIDNEPYFVGKDVAAILGYERPSKAILDHVEDEDKDEVPIQDSIGRMQNAAIINESGLYSLILSSKLPTAKRFKRWVTAEVLPTIRKTGGYVGNEDTFITTYLPYADEQTRLLFKATLETMKNLNSKIDKDRPKVLFADAVAVSESTILIGELAKVLKGNGIDVGQNRLFERLRTEGYLIKRSGTDYNSPSQKAMELGLFKIKETAITHSDGHVTVNKTTKVTGKGQQYFVNKFLSI